MRVLAARGRIVSLILVQERGRELLVARVPESQPSGPGTDESCRSGRTDGVLPLSAAWTHKEGLPQRQGSQGFGTTQSQSVAGQEGIHYVPPQRGTSQRGQSQF